ncbi:NAD(P)/FAD-dependent oxidoreductase [Spongiibacter marinus]|uniref:NAD(P)/FAD-dependent oxidoreductase n=1 Tax=Spongiibacter marinus TaxID=354246 RepID=UPI0019616F00|nr:FAD-dependent oxidoreductase [Spongiibacter marinus]MBM7421951.1 hypothetical protein [Spongiibacter marinus]
MSPVAIIGAGLSGLLCAKMLNECGLPVAVFEKSRGLGGRLARRRHPWGNVDIGAPLLALTPEQLQYFPRDAISAQPYTTAQWRDGKLLPQATQTHYTAAGSNNRLCHALADGIEVRRGQRVAAIHPTSTTLSLRDDKGEDLGDFSAVILATPAPQARDLIPTTSSLTIAETPWQAGWTVIVQFDGAWAPSEIIDIESHAILRRIVCLSSAPGRDHQHCYSIELTDDASHHFEQRSDNEIIDRVMTELASIAPTPPLLHSDIQRWRFARPETAVISDSQRADDSLKIALAGDYCVGGNAEGALRSATFAVQRVKQWLASAC